MGNYEKLKEKIKRLPQGPGVYIFKDAAGRVIYIGKAKSLKKRAQSYFVRELSSKTQALVSKIADVDYRPTSSESQAQILEAALIKENQPHYNISLKDDKSFPLIRISDEEFPVVSICRRKKAEEEDTCQYFGPYTDSELLRQALKLVRKIFGFRSCKTLPGKICLYGRIDLCPAPCIGRINRAGYAKVIDNIRMLLEGKSGPLIKKLSAEMQQRSKALDYEEAARLRNQISALSAITQGNPLVNYADEAQALKDLLKLDRLPQRIEGFDISNISGKEACGSMVSFYKGRPDKNNYRRFRIKTVAGIDDYAMLREVVRRRYSRLIEEGRVLPDLMLIDGGRQHLSAALEELSLLGVEMPAVSIAKERENIYTNGKDLPLKFKEDNAALNLIRRIRDEAHRFAVSYHHVLRRKKVIGR